MAIHVETKPAASAATSLAAGLIQQLRFARTASNKLLEGIPQDKLCAQPGACVNHATWVVGHLATTDDYFLKEFGPAGSTLTLPEQWHKDFGYGSKPTSDPKQYPAFAEVKKAFDERRAAVIKWFESMTNEQLKKPTPENWKDYAPTIGDIAPFAAWHEGYHAGQLAPLRHGLGLGPAFG